MGVATNQPADVRLDGMIHYRGEEIAQSARMLTTLALCHSYQICDGPFMLGAFVVKNSNLGHIHSGPCMHPCIPSQKAPPPHPVCCIVDCHCTGHFDKAKGLAGWLIGRRSLSLGHPPADPRYGMLPGDDEADNCASVSSLADAAAAYHAPARAQRTPCTLRCANHLLTESSGTARKGRETQGKAAITAFNCREWPVIAAADNRLYYHGQYVPLHFYSSNAETYRAFVELGSLWQTIGAASQRPDVVAHGAKLLKLAPLLYRDLHASLNRTMNTTADGDRCYPHRVEGNGPETVGQMSAL
eukprot:SAG22_NODE_440_length_10484_cov_19.751661_3_plen_300_part_00